MEVYPITIPMIRWEALMSAVDRPLASVGDFRSFIVTISDLKTLGINPTEAMRVADNVLGHLSFGFLVRGDVADLLDILAESGCTMTVIGDGEAMVSGTLKQWRDAIVRHLQEGRPERIVKFYDAVMVFFENLKLGELWRAWSKTSRPDGTFILT